MPLSSSSQPPHPTPQPAARRAHASFDQLHAALGAQQSLVQQLTTCSQRQSALIDADDAEALLDVLAQRQSLLAQLDSLQHQVDHLRSALAPQLKAGGLDASAVASRLDELSHAAAAVIASDRADSQRLTARRNALADELGKLGASRRAVAAYGIDAPPPSAPRFQDRRG